MTGKTVTALLREQYNDMFSAEKKVADLILRDPNAVLGMTVAELAKKSGVSDATVVRMCHHAGFKGYYQFRVMLARDLGSRQERRAAGSVEQIFRGYADRLEKVSAGLDHEAMKTSAGLIRSCAGQVHLAAVGNTMPLALHMAFRLGRLGIRSTSGVAPEYFLNNINLASPSDLMVAISQSGNSRQVIQAIGLAKEKGLKVISITASATSPVASLSDFVLVSGTADGGAFERDYSHLSEMAVADALMELVTNWEKIDETDADKPEEILSEYKV